MLANPIQGYKGMFILCDGSDESDWSAKQIRHINSSLFSDDRREKVDTYDFSSRQIAPIALSRSMNKP